MSYAILKTSQISRRFSLSTGSCISAKRLLICDRTNDKPQVSSFLGYSMFKLKCSCHDIVYTECPDYDAEAEKARREEYKNEWDKTQKWIESERYSDYYKKKGRETALIKKYGITSAEYENLLKGQGGGCALCGAVHEKNRKLMVDHNHNTKKVRGILCSKCNTGVGLLGDNLEGLMRAVEYLRRSEDASDKTCGGTSRQVIGR